MYLHDTHEESIPSSTIILSKVTAQTSNYHYNTMIYYTTSPCPPRQLFLLLFSVVQIDTILLH